MSTTRPVTTDGWYARTDGTWGYYGWTWRHGVSQPVCRKVWHERPAHYYVDNGRVVITDADENPVG